MTDFKINPEEWKYLFSREMSLFFSYLSAEGVKNYMKDFGMDIIVERICIGKLMHTDNFFLIPTLQNFGKLIVNKALTDKGYMKKVEKQIIDRSKKLIEISEKITKFKGSIKENKKIFTDYYKTWESLAPTLWVTMILGKSLNELVIKDLKLKFGSKYSDEEIELMISILTYPDESTPMKQEEINLLNIGAKIQSKEDIDVEKELKNHYEKYKFIPANFVNEAWTLEFFRKELNQKIKNYDCAKRIKELENKHKELLDKRKKLLNELSLSGKELLETEILRTTTFLNELRKFSYCKANYFIRDFLDYIAKNFKIGDWEDMIYLTNYEILDIIKEKNISKYKEIIKERKKLYVILRDKDGNLCLLEDEEAKLIEDQLIYPKSKKEKKVDLIEGMIVSGGNAKGIVKILKTVEDMNKVQEGDIIVAEMTSVDFVPVMRIASAFVTDLGGITCHTAIVARELGVPAIVGTEIATKVLKDGYLVEVDAEKGVIKILKRKALLKEAYP